MSTQELMRRLEPLRAQLAEIEKGGVEPAEEARYNAVRNRIREVEARLRAQGNAASHGGNNAATDVSRTAAPPRSGPENRIGAPPSKGPETVVEGSTGDGSQQQRLVERAGDVNQAIATMVSTEVTPIVAGMDRAATAFPNWYDQHAQERNAGVSPAMAGKVFAFVLNYFPDNGPMKSMASRVFDVIQRGQAESAAARQAGARDFENKFRAAANRLQTAFGPTFGERVQREQNQIWSMVGIMILDGNTGDARNTLIAELGVPRPQGNIARQILAQMIAEYRRWERRYLADHGSIEAQLTVTDPNVEAGTVRGAGEDAEQVFPD